MKNIIKIFTVSLIFILASCTDWLDLRPENEVVLEDYWQTESQATSVLASCYRGMLLDDYVKRMVVWGELRSDNLFRGNSTESDLLKILTVNITPTNSYANWGVYYSVINFCNTFLTFAPAVLNRDPNFTTSELHAYESEALTIRALSYFYLVRAFRDVPLVLNPSISDTTNYQVPKASERQLLDQIIKDLTQAIVYAKTDYGKGAYNKGRITKNAVYAILADVYLWDKQYAKCIEMCNYIIADHSLKLVDADKLVSSVFYEGNSTESIFELQYDKDVQYNNTVNSFYGFDGNFGQFSYPVYLSPKGLFSPFNYTASTVKESTEDIREKVFVSPTDYGDGYQIYKYVLAQSTKNEDDTYSPKLRSSSVTVNWIVYRLSDIILMRAEALVQLDRNDNDLKEALKMVNKTYLRSNVKDDSLQFVNYNDKSSMEKLVLRERHRELMFEGKRWFDLMRVVRRNENNPSVILEYISPKFTGDNMQVKKMSVYDGLFFPIHKDQLELDSLLKQNPFYENSEFVN